MFIVEKSKCYSRKLVDIFLLAQQVLQDNECFEQSLIFILFLSVSVMIVLVDDLTNPKHTMVCFETIPNLSGCKLNPTF